MFKSIYIKVIVAALLLYTLVGFIVIPFLLVNNSSKLFNEQLGCEGHISKAYFNPYTFYVEIDQLLLYDKEHKPLLYFDELIVNFDPLYIFNQVAKFQIIYLKDLTLDISILKDKKFNFDNILTKLNTAETNQTKQTDNSKSIDLKIDKLFLDDTRASFCDYSLKEPFDIHTKSFDFNIDNLSTVIDEKGNLDIKIDTHNSGQISTKANLTLEPFKLDGQLNISGLNIKKLFSYIEESVNFKIYGNTVDASTNYQLRYDNAIFSANLNKTALHVDHIGYKDKMMDTSLKSLLLSSDKIRYSTTDNLRVNSSALHVENFSFNDKINTLKLHELNSTLRSLTLDPKNIYDVNVTKIALNDLELTNRKNPLIDLENITASSLHVEPESYYLESLSADKLDAILRVYKNSKTDIDYITEQNSPENKDSNESKKEIDLFIKSIALNQSSFTLKDYKADSTLTFNDINSKLNGFSLKENTDMPFYLSLKTPKSGKVELDSTISLTPFLTDAKLKASKVSLKAYEPYIREFANIKINSGSLDSSLRIKLDNSKKEFKKNIKGDIFVNNISLNHLNTKEKLTSIKKLSVKNLKLNDKSLIIKNITLDKPYVKVAIDENKSTNFSDLVVNNGKKSTKKSSKKDDFNLLIAKFSIKNGISDFSDFSLPLHFKTHIDNIKGDVYAISSDKNDITNFELAGTVDKYGMSTLSGGIIPSEIFKNSEINVDFSNIDVSSLSPYSSKFIGNKIKTGKLWLDLKYDIKDYALKSSNNMKIKDLELGEHVDSPEAINAPVGLAIALLKDSNGFIDVKIPVDGDVNSPNFHFSDAVLSALTNVITSIVSAPFRLLGSIIGVDNEDLGDIEFTFGSSELTPPQKEKLDLLADALSKRPELILVLTPTYDNLRDTYALKQKQLIETFLKEFDENDDISSKYDFITSKYEEIMGEKALESEISFFEKYLSEDPNFKEKLSNYLIEKMIEKTVLPNDALDKLANMRIINIKNHLESQGFDSSKIVLTKKIDSFDEKSDYIKFKMKLDSKE